MAGYSGKPLASKMGLTTGHLVLLDGAPTAFEFDGLPPGVTVHRRPAGTAHYDAILCFCADLARLERRWPALHGRTTSAGALWIAWSKRSAGVATDLDENMVRDYALTHGRVDVKVCAVDEVWSGLKHVVRKADR